MTGYPLLGSIDPHHQRLGYLTALCLVATRDYSSRDALTSRVHDVLYRKVYHDEPEFERLFAHALPDDREALLQTAQENAANPDLSPASILAAPERQQPWLTINTLWIHDQRMPSALGELTEKKTYRIVDFARMLGILLPGFDLSETGFLVKHLVTEIKQAAAPGTFNPLCPDVRACMPVLYLRLLLENDVLFPFLIHELVQRTNAGARLSTRGPEGVLLAATEALLGTIGAPAYPDEILAIQNITAYRDAIANNQSTQENYLRPRLEMLVDLAYLDRRKNATPGKGEFVWRINDCTSTLDQEAESLRRFTSERDTFMDAKFFGTIARSQHRQYRAVTKHEEILLHFTKALQRVKRDFGFTPGRTGALLTCLLAWEDGKVLEIQQVFDAVYAAAKSDLNAYLHFSGGSRFDREFLIRIDEELQPLLEQRCAEAPQ